MLIISASEAAPGVHGGEGGRQARPIPHGSGLVFQVAPSSGQYEATVPFLQQGSGQSAIPILLDWNA